MRMPKMQVYLPADLYERVKARSDELNVSALLQDALAQRLAQLDRLDAARAALPTTSTSTREPDSSRTPASSPRSGATRPAKHDWPGRCTQSRSARSTSRWRKRLLGCSRRHRTPMSTTPCWH